MSNTKFKYLAQPIYIGKLRLKNRMMKNGTGFFWDDPATRSHIDDKYIAFFEALAKGGAALVSSAVGPLTRDLDAPMPGYRIRSDEFIPGWKKWADAIHKYDCLAFHQLFHLGPMVPLFGTAPAGVSASSIPKELSPIPRFHVPREITIPEIEDIVDLFASGAERMKKAGLDGTELNGACNHLLNNFLSRAWNKRTDEYGPQTIENRTRIYVNIIKEIKRRNGKDWPIIALMNALEVNLKDGITIDESKQFAQKFVEAGADAIEIRAEYYKYANDNERRESLHFPDAYLYPGQESELDNLVYSKEHGKQANILMAAEIKKAVNVPVIVMGKMDWKNGNKAIKKGQVDIISMTRRLLADPELPKKVLENRIEDINPCNSCMTCFDAGEHFRPVLCRVNASLGHEREYEIKPAPVRKKIMIIGGGPSGLEAARVLALRGHKVMLFDNQSKLGGCLPIAAMVKGMEREDIPGLIKYLDRQVRKVGVEVHTGTTVTPATVDEVKPDVIIVATGGTHDIPQIPGINRWNVATSEKMHHQLKFFIKFFSPKILRKLSLIPFAMSLFVRKNVVIIGGRLHGCQTAEYLLHMGRKITIVDTGTEKDIGDGLLEVFIKPYLMYWLKDHGVKFVTEVEYKEITSKGLVVKTKDGKTELIEADTIITALPLLPNTGFFNSIKGKVKEVYSIGDAENPGYIVDAIGAGAKIGREI
ncbi:FAD-dependent oxidoreductase [Deltaproteobacteria bacterium]|nr:FAD-dependent oxidoreductase [Deltaproteobacteria bacterium]